MEKCKSCGYVIPRETDVEVGKSIPCSEYHVRCIRCQWPVAKTLISAHGLCVMCMSGVERRKYNRRNGRLLYGMVDGDMDRKNYLAGGRLTIHGDEYKILEKEKEYLKRKSKKSGERRMRKILVLLICFSAISSSVSGSVSRIVGLNSDCGSACVSIPLSATVLCQAPSFCSRIAVPDWTNDQRFYGTDGSNCRVSNDGAVTWSNCPANPSSTATYLNYAVAGNGAIIAVGNDSGGAVLRIKRSTDGAVSWSTVFETSNIENTSNSISPNVKLRCSRYSNICVYPYRDVSGTARVLTSTDNGVSWTESSLGAIVYSNGPFVLTSSSTSEIGMWFPFSSDGVGNFKPLLFTNGTWTLGSIIPTTTGGQCNWNYVINGNRRAICHVGGTGTSYEVRNETGTVINTFTLPDVPSDNGGVQIGLSISVRSTGVWLLRTITTGRTGLWVSNDSGVTFVKIFETDPVGAGIGNQGGIFEGVNGCIYAAWLTGSGTSTVIRVC